jgi:hypothetical protein
MKLDGLTPVIEIDITKPLDENVIESVSLKAPMLVIRFKPLVTVGIALLLLGLAFLVMKK